MSDSPPSPSSSRKRRLADRKKSAKASLAALKEARNSGLSRLEQYQVAEDNPLYDEVNEDDYKRIVKQRLKEDDFVVDDDGSGYADLGFDDWNTKQYYSDDDEDTKKGRKNPEKKNHSDYINVCHLILQHSNPDA
ncbi:DNA polymerase alpha subunit p180 N terminal-domain-containing protein [Paraphysoderma sedebokerense]|nr:DNA polymerase alpha subunit p180 N terminal-domain-containing protein [Paraphysoderma sedebokerense]